jgi:DNA-binding GntR family transcriptional regulator
MTPQSIPVAATSIVDAIAADLRTRLFSGELSADTPLTETDMATSYNVARPTVKAAIERLVAEGLLVRGLHKTARVAALGPAAVSDIYRSRAYLESEILRRLARKRLVPAEAVAANAEIGRLSEGTPIDLIEPDIRFHLSLIDAVGSDRMSKMYRSLMSEVRLCMNRVQSLGLLAPGLIHAEHEQILKLIAAGEGDAAAALLDDHLGRARERLIKALGGEPGPQADTPTDLLDPS